MKPTVNKIYDILRKYDSLTVHISGAPKGTGKLRSNHLYPKDLQHVISGKAEGGLSCSTVIPGDCFHGVGGNATGWVGVILGLKTTNSLLYVSRKDCGSYENAEGRLDSLRLVIYTSI